MEDLNKGLSAVMHDQSVGSLVFDDEGVRAFIWVFVLSA